VAVEFIQCPRRWRAYSFHRQQYLDAGGRADIRYERPLWHGTALENVSKIAVQGAISVTT
jgi:hypothetical protein